MTRELDLAKRLRPGLDILANEIVISLKKRSRFKVNPEIYKPGLVLGQPEISLLDYELGRTERLHAELGRYLYANQESYTDVSGVRQVIRRRAPQSPICNFATGLAGEMKAFYIEWIHEACPEGSDSNSYGEAVTSDVSALLNLYERVNLGKYVAEYKFRKHRIAFMESRGDPGILESLVVNREREENVLELAGVLARHYDFNEKQARKIFARLIEFTVKIELEYIRQRLRMKDQIRDDQEEPDSCSDSKT